MDGMPSGIAGPVIGAAGALGGGVIGAVTSSVMNEQNRKWEEQMSNTQYQRAVADMKQAGLNPALMYTKAQPAGVPPPPYQQNPGAALASAIPTAARDIGYYVSVDKPKLDMAKAANDATVSATNAQTAKTAADTILSQLEAVTKQFSIDMQPNTRAQAEQTLKNLTAQLGNINSLTDLNISKSIEADQDARYRHYENMLIGMLMPYAQKGFQALNSIIGDLASPPGPGGKSIPDRLWDYFITGPLKDSARETNQLGKDFMDWLGSSAGAAVLNKLKGWFSSLVPSKPTGPATQPWGQGFPGESTQAP